MNALDERSWISHPHESWLANLVGLSGALLVVLYLSTEEDAAAWVIRLLVALPAAVVGGALWTKPFALNDAQPTVLSKATPIALRGFLWGVGAVWLAWIATWSTRVVEQLDGGTTVNGFFWFAFRTSFLFGWVALGGYLVSLSGRITRRAKASAVRTVQNYFPPMSNKSSTATVYEAAVERASNVAVQFVASPGGTAFAVSTIGVTAWRLMWLLETYVQTHS
ncbi:hypothetical protein [Demequina capsici]|uniref:Uncharacterized protein n=1 Tax=Demequina capsici TaxID=3075620 RepID=A0AA96J5W2_9MICO|nr:hypothetical protein [Demequina sp. OYTSA14]WNM23532.1 hypothetical protein RN606_09145 [Demequina sp. OYTSA14]